MPDGYRIEKDSLGEIKVPENALYGAQTQRAVENFPISGQLFGRRFIEALGLIKKSAAEVNAELGVLDEEIAEAVGIERQLRQLGIDEGDMPMLAHDVMAHTRLLVNNPRELTEGAAQKIYEAAW